MRIIEESQIQNDFNGFEDEKTIFEMQSGSKWQQIEELGNYYLQVDSMNDKVLFKKIYTS